MKYKYTVSEQLDTSGRYTKRPIVEVTIATTGAGRKFYALVDSGADQILMPATIAEVLGIDRTACRTRSVVGVSMEPVEGFVAELSLHIKDQPQPFSAPVVFIDADIPILLGREGFFERHRIKFEQDHDVLEIMPV